jgi:hypothetical protein
MDCAHKKFAKVVEPQGPLENKRNSNMDVTLDIK